jgi:hypothetical protein
LKPSAASVPPRAPRSLRRMRRGPMDRPSTSRRRDLHPDAGDPLPRPRRAPALRLPGPPHGHHPRRAAVAPPPGPPLPQPGPRPLRPSCPARARGGHRPTRARVRPRRDRPGRHGEGARPGFVARRDRSGWTGRACFPYDGGTRTRGSSRPCIRRPRPFRDAVSVSTPAPGHLPAARESRPEGTQSVILL